MNHPSKPISNSASNFKTSRVVTVGNDELKIEPTLASISASILFFVFLYGIFAYMIYGGALVLIESDSYLLGFLLLFAGLLLAWGFSRSNLLTHEIIKLDRNGNSYRRYRMWRPNQPIDSKNLSDFTEVQILKKIVKTHNSQRSVEFTSYEINLCSINSGRINIIDHGVENEIIDDANIIARFINIPVTQSNA